MLAALGCGGSTSEAGRFTAALARAQLDTVRLAVPVTAAWCRGGGGVLVEGLEPGTAVLLWVGGDPDRAYPIFDPADSVATVHARVVVRYPTGDLVQTLVLDSGTVDLARSADSLRGRVTGSGYDAAAGFRPQFQGGFHGVVLNADSVVCRDGAGAPGPGLD